MTNLLTEFMKSFSGHFNSSAHDEDLRGQNMVLWQSTVVCERLNITTDILIEVTVGLLWLGSSAQVTVNPESLHM